MATPPIDDRAPDAAAGSKPLRAGLLETANRSELLQSDEVRDLLLGFSSLSEHANGFLSILYEGVHPALKSGDVKKLIASLLEYRDELDSLLEQASAIQRDTDEIVHRLWWDHGLRGEKKKPFWFAQKSRRPPDGNGAEHEDLTADR